MRCTAPWILVAVAAASAACALVSPGPPAYFVRVAEGLTSPSRDEPMSIAPRMLAASQLVEACQEPRRVARLEAPAPTLDLSVGDRLALSTLRVVAVSAGAVALPGVPVAVEVEERSPPVVRLRSDDPDLNAGRLLIAGSGRFRIRIRTLCANSPAETIITAVVTA
jgi:hypothetical protein